MTLASQPAGFPPMFERARAMSNQTPRKVEIVPPAEEPEQTPPFLSLTTLLERPDILDPPASVIPRIVHKGRTTLLAAPDKAGKSTLAACAASSLSRRGEFLGEPVGATTGRVVWVGLEEAIGDAVRRFSEMGAVPDNIQLIVVRNAEILNNIRALLTEWPADLLVVDSLTEYARILRGSVPEDGDTSGWASVIRPLVGLTRDFPELGSFLQHHPRRSDGQFRGSGEIAAAVDCLFEMRNPDKNEDQTIRHITGRARWEVTPFDIRFTEGRYELAGGASLSLDARVLIAIEQNHGIKSGKLRKLVGGRSSLVDKSVIELVNRGAILDLGKREGDHAFFPAAGRNQEALGLVP